MSHTLIALVTAIVALGPPEKPSAPCNESICQRDLRADLFFLAGDAFQGRLTDTPGNTLAAGFIASRFARMGLKPMGSGGSFFQPFLLSTASLGTNNKLAISTGYGPKLRFRVGEDFVPLTLSPTTSVSAFVTFAGFGISDSKRGRDDYEHVQLPQSPAGSPPTIALVLAHEPGENDPQSPFDGLVMSEDSLPLSKALTAQEKGAVGVLIVTDVHNHPGPENFQALTRGIWPDKPPRIPHYTLQDSIERVRIPVAAISRNVAMKIFDVDERRLEKLARASENPREGQDVKPSYNVSLDTDVIHHTVPDRNVVAAIEGCDPKLKDEWVIVSCHVDHNGADGDHIYNGADDNGSGVVGMLEIAEAYSLAARQGHRPKRSVMFIAFNSEERRTPGGLRVHRTPARAAGEDRRRAQHGHDRPQRGSAVGWQPAVPWSGGPDSRVKPECSQSAGLQLHAVAGEDRRAGQCHVWPDAQAESGQQRVEPAPPQRPLAVPAARGSGRLHPHRPAPRLSHPRRPPGEDRVRQDGAHRPPGPPGKLEPR